MLNISTNSITEHIERYRYQALQEVEEKHSGKVLLRLMIGLAIFFFILLFIPWTQNIRSEGNVTALKPDQRPQTINSIIAGRIERWYVQEGDFVSRGDTILYISEIKDEYFDPDLLKRTEQQVSAKTMSVGSYDEKVRALDNQIGALEQSRELKLQQARNKLQQAKLKVVSDSMDYQAAKINANTP